MIIPLIGLIILLSMLPSCLGPKHIIPPVPLPSQFEYQQNKKNITTDISLWWEQFNDTYLNHLINQALTYNYERAIAIEQIEEARALYQFKKAQLIPTINANAHIDRTRLSKSVTQNSVLIKPTNSLFQLGFDTVWEIDFWGKIWRGKNARYFSLQAQVEHMHDVSLILIADVARTYIDLCALNRILDLTHHKIDLHQQLVTLQTDLQRAGLSDEIAVAQRIQNYQEIKNIYEQLTTDQLLAKNRMAVLLGTHTQNIQTPTCHNVPLSTIALNTGLPSDILRRRPDIRQKERELAAANELIGQAIAEWFPSFNLLGGVGTAASKGAQLFKSKNLIWDIGTSVTWPILNFGKVRATINTRKSEKRQAALAYSQTIINALAEIEDFLGSYFQNKKQHEIITIKLAQSIHEKNLIRDKFHAGLANESAYLESRIQVINNKITLTSLEQLSSTHLISLYKALGGGW